MERECKIKDQRPVEVDGFYKIFVGDRKYAVKINERDPEGELTISREYGVYYRLVQGEDGYELYTNRGKIYPKEDMEEDNESKNNAGSNSNSGSTNSSGSSYGHAGGYGSGSFYGNASGSGSGSTSGHSSGSGSLKRQIPTMWMITMIPMILRKNGQKILEMGIMMTDTMMLMITGKKSMMINRNT